ncbi:uncharacterized protein K460DRAFT_369117 [Cucurbitaria berberidis CBS 394.84]|uniref:F-box domain-containing protein n=1 Tax=Cucurbitaria berberidis CBS 394.84 TaxID=1168544 RepID=A0A9P4L7F2_9PLEO|nr:uncharacterized protein K460DRAFT_369117 [Cucurbitaria berberidis CBS 394.84]KAF1844249.1 hypothetical protein K460DRAFT_369117 [Cucurbitaria berberidis CBS 394.84]
MTSLLTIPLELLISISSFVPTSDLASLRLTCKQIEKSLYEWFSGEFFTKKQFMLTPTSLQALIDISKHVSFSKKLTHIIIATDVYDEIPLRFRDSHAAMCYIKGYEDQKVLLSTGIDREMLTEAFQNLVNLDTVGMRDFNAPSRVRDGDHASWSSWGATTVHKNTGISLRSSSDPNYLSHVFSTIIHALGKANRTPSHFEVLLRQNGLPGTAFFLPDFLQSTAEPVLHNVKTLLLNVDLTFRYLHTHSNGVSVDAHAGRAMRRFLGYTPNLTHLRLNFQKHLVANNEAFMEWLGEPPPALRSQPVSFFEPAPIALPFLRHLDFGQLNVRPDILVAIVTKFAPTLEDMNLWRMGLQSRAPPPFGHKPNLWSDFFAKLSSIPQLELKHFKAGMLQQDYMFVNFKVQDEEARLLKTKEHTGKQMEKFLKELAKHVTVAWPAPVLQDDDDDSDEDEEMASFDDEDEDDEDDEDAEDDEE